jgi:hypothetical protein
MQIEKSDTDKFDAAFDAVFGRLFRAVQWGIAVTFTVASALGSMAWAGWFWRCGFDGFDFKTIQIDVCLIGVPFLVQAVGFLFGTWVGCFLGTEIARSLEGMLFGRATFNSREE